MTKSQKHPEKSVVRPSQVRPQPHVYCNKE
uniref:Uncharacterized protein n=1 Tax=Anguilla anguilla TaxID=7936 RepID=A0A0E9TDZ2_ANGAN